MTDKDEKNKSKEIRKQINSYDLFIKHMMSRKIVAQEFFETYLPQRVLDIVDLSTLKQEGTEFTDRVLGKGTVDMLHSINLKGKKGYIISLLEHQSKPDKEMSFRVQKYVFRICDDHHRKYPGKPFPVVQPMVLYTGKRKYNAPLHFSELFNDPDLAKTCLESPLHLIDLNEVKDIDLKHKYHVGITLYLMQKIHEQDIFPHLERIAPLLALIGKEDFNCLQDVLYFILNKAETKQRESVIELFKDATPEEPNKGKIMSIANAIRAEGLEEGIHQGMQQGMQRGIQQGFDDGVHKVAKKLLINGVDITIISHSTGLTKSEILKLKG